MTWGVLALSGLILVATLGCAAWYPPPASPKPGLAETDDTLSKPLRPGQAAEDDAELPWYDMRNVLDPRSRAIEKHLGV